MPLGLLLSTTAGAESPQLLVALVALGLVLVLEVLHVQAPTTAGAQSPQLLVALVAVGLVLVLEVLARVAL